jgi:DnaJ-class molecular chaperone
MSRTIKMSAKKNGTCRNCDKPIRIGQQIYWARGAGAVHCNCEMARLQDTLCTACNGAGVKWNNAPCQVCDGTGDIHVQQCNQRAAAKHYANSAPMGGIDVDIAYEDSCRDACGL